jgi:hypothetical protein
VKNQNSLYIVVIPERPGQMGGVQLVAGRDEAKRLMAAFRDPSRHKLSFPENRRTTANLVDAINPHLPAPVLLKPVAPKAAPKSKPRRVKSKPRWAVKHEDGTLQKAFETAEAANECVASLRNEYRDGYGRAPVFIVEKVA